MPKVRSAMILFAKNRKGGEAKLTVTEMRDAIRLSVDQDNDDLGVRHVDLTLPEACALSDMLNRIRRKLATRPEYRP
jgi:hypothetical protein